MKARLLKIAKWVAYPSFYLFSLVVSFYLTFPWDKVKDRVVAEFDKSQASKGDKAWRLELGTLSGYWWSGVEITGAKIVIPADDDKSKGGSVPTISGAPLNPAVLAAAKSAGGGDSGDDAKPKDKDAAKGPKDGIILVERLRARVRLLPLLIGRVRVDFSAQAFGGEVKGTVPIGSGTLDVDVAHVDLSQVAPLRDLVTVPVKGVASGKIEISNEGGKWSKAVGSLALTITDVAIGDGKTKLAGMATLPPAQLGKLEISAKATDGLLKFEKFGATGKDVEIVGNGFLRLKEPWDSSALDLVIRVGFSEAYRQKDDKTKSLFGDPNDPFPALIDQNPQMKKAKREDGMYGFRGRGPLRSLKWEPTTEDGPAGAPPAAGTADAAAAAGAKKKPPPVGPTGGAKLKGFNVDHVPGSQPTPGAEARTPATPDPTPATTPEVPVPAAQPGPALPIAPLPIAPPAPPPGETPPPPQREVPPAAEPPSPQPAPQEPAPPPQ
jgi:type II secretion system protein N